MVTVTGTFLRPDDTPCTGAVTFAVYVAASDTTPDDRVVTPAPVVVRLDDSGSFTVDLVASDDDGWQTDGPMPYTIGINVTGQRAYNYAAYINDPGPHDIGELVVLDWPPNVANIPTDGPQGPQGEAALIVGSFTRDPAELPPDGFLPADWDSPGKPANDLQCLLGYAIIHYPSGHLWSFVGPEKYAPGWVDSGKVTGPQGDPGPQGDAATVDVGTTTTGDAGTDAAVANSGTTFDAVFDFTIPKGDKGDKGEPGALSDDDPLPVGDTNDPGTDQLGSRADHTHAGTRITRPNVDDRLTELHNPAANSGAGGWSVVDYNSGWRDVTEVLSVNNSAVLNAAHLLRVGNVVYFRADVTCTTSGSVTFSGVPSGFVGGIPTNPYEDAVWTDSSAAAIALMRFRGSNGWSFYGPAVSGKTFRGIAVTTTSDPVPTSLPGTLYTPAPQ